MRKNSKGQGELEALGETEVELRVTLRTCAFRFFAFRVVETQKAHQIWSGL